MITAAVLKDSLKGEVHTDLLRRHMLSTDGSIFSLLPACVVYPACLTDVVAVVRFASRNKLSVHARGTGSGLCGSALGRGIVIDFSKFMNRLIEINIEDKSFTCEPGYRLGELEVALKNSGLFFPPDPSSGEYASFGGMYATNASGAHSIKYGNVADYILDAEVVLANGEVISVSKIMSRPPETLPENLRQLFALYNRYRETIESGYPDILCNVSGYNLRRLGAAGHLDLSKLFAGAEGTLGIVTRLTFRLLERPAHDSLVVAYFDDIINAAAAVGKLLPLKPAGIEVMDKSLLNIAKKNDETLKGKIPDGIDNVLLIEFDGVDGAMCRQRAEDARVLLKKEKLTENAYVAACSEEKAKFWAIRKAAVPILYKLKGEKKILALIEDAAVPTNRLTDYFKGIYEIFDKNGVDFVLYGHIAKGLIHTRPLLDLKQPQDVALLKTIAEQTFALVQSLGGVVSGEHGDGRIRSPFIKAQYPDLYALFVRTKRLLDPLNLFNPEIITYHDPGQMQKHLRYGVAYRSQDRVTGQLNWPEGFTREVEKCHGCSKCTTVTTATRMCPVYKFTRDEAAAPKAKANLLRALISGAVADRQLYEKAFQSVMDHCANCGSCYFECPSAVNIPKMAMEARARYVKRFGASLHSRFVTHVELAGRTTRKISKTIHSMMRLKIARQVGEAVSRVSARRRFIEFAADALFERIHPREGTGDIHVLYFAGCFAGYIKPQIGEALVAVFKQMGVTVHFPPQHCCGLPALSKGMVKAARNSMEKNVEKWGHLISRVDHVVVTCSSCGYTLMNDWAYLAAGPLIKPISEKVIHASRFIDQYATRLSLKPYNRSVAYHQPCHLKIQPDPGSSLRLLSKIPGLEVSAINSHCCGMIGAWGMAAKNYALSMKIGAGMMEKLNQPNIFMGLTDCPTCRIQMEENTTKPVRHPVEVVANCLSV